MNDMSDSAMPFNRRV